MTVGPARHSSCHAEPTIWSARTRERWAPQLRGCIGGPSGELLRNSSHQRTGARILEEGHEEARELRGASFSGARRSENSRPHLRVRIADGNEVDGDGVLAVALEAA